MNAGQFLSRLVTVALNRDGQAHALEEGAVAGFGGDAGIAAGARLGPAAGTPAPTSRRDRRAILPDTMIQEAVALKLLHAWLQNRHQTLYPLTLNLRGLDANGRGIVLQAMACAAHADGRVEDEERQRVLGSLSRLGAGEADRRLLIEALAEPAPLAPLLRDIQEAGLGAHAYGASLIAINQRSRVNQLYLEYLAARLGLPPEVVSSLNRRYRA